MFYNYGFLLQHKYVSIAEVQIQKEDELQQCPMTLVSNVTSLCYDISNQEPGINLIYSILLYSL